MYYRKEIRKSCEIIELYSELNSPTVNLAKILITINNKASNLLLCRSPTEIVPPLETNHML